MVEKLRGSLRLSAALLVISALLLAACGGSGGDSNPDTTEGSTETTSGSTDTTVADSSDGGETSELSGTVRWTMLNYDDGVQAWVDDIVTRFEEMHPGVTVEATLPATNQYQDLITTQVQGGNPPDLAALATAWVPAFANAGELALWDEQVSAELLDRFDPTLLAGAQFNGEQVALPYLSTARALYYNQAALDAVGADVPTTWDELIDTATKISDDDTVDYGFAFQGAGVEAFAAWFPYTYWAAGGEFTTDGSLSVDPQACLTAVTTLNDLVTSGATQPDVTSFDLPEQMGLFTSGEAAMTITGPWMIPAIEDDLPFGVAPIPAGPGGQATLGVQDAFVLFKNGGNTEAAVALAEFIYEADNADTLVEGRGMLPVLTEGFDAPRYQEDPLKTFVEMLPSAKFAPQSDEWTALMDIGTQALQDMYVSGTSPEDTCNAITAGGGGL